MKLIAYPTLLEKLRDRAYRRAFRSAAVRNHIALQVRTLRKAKYDSQKKLAEACNKPANVITRLENPNYGRVSVKTMLELADAFDVGLSVRFVPFGEMAAENEDLSIEALNVPSFEDEVREPPSLPAADVQQTSKRSALSFDTTRDRLILGSVPINAGTQSRADVGHFRARKGGGGLGNMMGHA